MSLEQKAEQIAEEFEISSGTVAERVNYFQVEMENGLSQPSLELSQMPTYVTKLPSSAEKAPSTIYSNLALCLISNSGTGYLSHNRLRRYKPASLLCYIPWGLHHLIEKLPHQGSSGCQGVFKSTRAIRLHCRANPRFPQPLPW